MTFPASGFVALTSSGGLSPPGDAGKFYTTTGSVGVSTDWAIFNFSGVTLTVSGPNWSGTVNNFGSKSWLGSGTVTWS